MSEIDLAEIMEFERAVYEALMPLTPVLFHIDQDDTEAALRRFTKDLHDPELKSQIVSSKKRNYKLFDFFANCEYLII